MKATPSVWRLLVGLLAAMVALGLLLGAVLVFAPGATVSQWFSTRLGLAQVLAFPVPAGIGLVCLALLVLIAGRAVQAAGQLWARTVAASLAVLGLGLLTFPQAPPWTATPSPATGNTGRHLRVAVFNSLDTLTAVDVQDIINTADPDVLVLPEASPDRVAQAMAGTAFTGGIHEGLDAGFSEGRPPWVAPTVIAVHPRAGTYRSLVPTPTTYGAVRLEPANANGAPTIIGVHTAPPLPHLMDSWRADLQRLGHVDQTAPPGPMILAGDFNATLRHGPLADTAHLTDTAQHCPTTTGGTWPSSVWAWLRSPIDHVLVTPDVEVLSCAVLEVGASDHLAYAVELRLPTP